MNLLAGESCERYKAQIVFDSDHTPVVISITNYRLIITPDAELAKSVGGGGNIIPRSIGLTDLKAAHVCDYSHSID
jgi:hypothetical protein